MSHVEKQFGGESVEGEADKVLHGASPLRSLIQPRDCAEAVDMTLEQFTQ